VISSGSVFTGKVTHALDSKGRVAIPVRYRALLPEGSQIALGPGPCLILVTPELLVLTAQRILESDMTDEDKERARSSWFGQATPILPDAQGRMVIPHEMREWAGLSTQVVFRGEGEYAKLLAPEAQQADDQEFLPGYRSRKFRIPGIS
jgi:MraZ protein